MLCGAVVASSRALSSVEWVFGAKGARQCVASLLLASCPLSQWRALSPPSLSLQVDGPPSTIHDTPHDRSSTDPDPDTQHTQSPCSRCSASASRPPRVRRRPPPPPRLSSVLVRLPPARLQPRAARPPARAGSRFGSYASSRAPDRRAAAPIWIARERRKRARKANSSPLSSPQKNHTASSRKGLIVRAEGDAAPKAAPKKEVGPKRGSMVRHGSV